MPLIIFFGFIICSYLIGRLDPNNDTILSKLVDGLIPMIFVSMLIAIFLAACVATFGQQIT